MFKKFLICVAPSEAHAFCMVGRLQAGGFSNARIRTFLGFERATITESQSPSGHAEDLWSSADGNSSFSVMGFPDLEAQRYDEMLRAGRIVICVQTNDPDEMEDVMQIFQEARGEEISSVADAWNAPVGLNNRH